MTISNKASCAADAEPTPIFDISCKGSISASVGTTVTI